MQLLFSLLLLSWLSGNHQPEAPDTVFCTHRLVLDNGLIVPWHEPRDNAFDHFLRLRWDFVLKRVPLSPGPLPRSSYPQYYFYCAFRDNHGTPEPDTWMNDVGEKIPNWFENARLYYAYTGDTRPMDIVTRMIDYSLEHGTSPSNFAWPGIPYTTTNAGDTVFRGFTAAGRFSLHEIQVDHAGEMGLTYFRMYQYSGEKKYLDAALRIADVLAQKARNGTDEKSVWPYRVIMNTGKITAEYGANWTGSYLLLDNLVKSGLGNVKKYAAARDKAQDFLLRYPMKSGYWTDGHSDTQINSNTYKSNLSASNATLFLFDHPEFTPRWKQDIPALIRWTEDNFINRSAPGEPSQMWGANIVGEQDSFLYKMDYQTARYAASCARWYAVSGDATYREKAYRALSLVTYCNDTTGMAYESPFSHGILSWWSDCYGECPRMFYQAFAGVPEWAPPHENHILYSEGVLKNVAYADLSVQYEATSDAGTEYLRLNFKPGQISINGNMLEFPESGNEAVEIRKLENGDYALTLHRVAKGQVVISSPKPEPDDWYAGDIHVHQGSRGSQKKQVNQ